MKQALSVIKTVITWLIIVVAVAMMVFTIVSVNTFDRADRNIFGYKAFIVLSDSMSATDFSAGDLVLVREVDPTTLQAGDIVAFTSQNTENFGEVVTHKIREVTRDAEGNPAFVTYGTTTGSNDETLVTYPFVIGKYQSHLAKVGLFFTFLKTVPGYICCILIPFLLLIILQLINFIKTFRAYKAEQMEELEAERAQIEEDRKRSEEMMNEILALKAQLSAQQQNAPPTAPQPSSAEPVQAEEAEESKDEATTAEETKPEEPAEVTEEKAEATSETNTEV